MEERKDCGMSWTNSKGWVYCTEYASYGMLSQNRVYLWWCGGNTFCLEYFHNEDREPSSSREFVKGYRKAIDAYIASCEYATVNGHFNAEEEREAFPSCFGSPCFLDWCIV